MAKPQPFTKEGGRAASQGKARHLPEESEAEGFSGWDRWLLGKPCHVGVEGARRKDDLPVC